MQDGKRDAQNSAPTEDDTHIDANAPVDADAPIDFAADDGSAADAEQVDRVGMLEAELSEAKDARLRALAEVENVRRRATREREESARYGGVPLARDLLSVADNIRRALDAMPEDARQSDAMAGLANGVEMVERELLSAFEKHHIVRVAEIGAKFDPNRHQAMFELETADMAPGHVAQVLQAGYVLHDRLLRPALVGVSKAPAAGSTPPSAPGGEGDRGGQVDHKA